MRRFRMVMLLFVAVLTLIGLGLLGFQSVQGENDIAEIAPSVVTVDIGDVQQRVDAPGQTIGTREILLSMGADGPLAKITVRPGDPVQKGQLLAQLGNQEALMTALIEAEHGLILAEEQLRDIYDQAPLVAAQAQMDLASAQEELEKAKAKNYFLQEGNRASEETLAMAKAKIILAEEEIRRADKEFSKLSNRSQDDPLRASASLRLAEAKQKRDAAVRGLNWYNGHPTEFQQAILDAEIAIAEANLLMAELNWDRVKDGPDPDLLMEAKSRITRAEQQVEQAQDALLGSELYAPFSGVILEVNAIPGKFVRGGEGFILLGELSELEVVVTIIEEDFPQIEIGQSVELFFDATPESEAFGVVDRVVPRRLPGDRPLYAVYITFDHIPDGLVAGMTADASIITASVEQVLRLPKSLVKARTGQSAKVEVWMDGYREERNVQIGLRGDRYVEILYGLQVGEQVITE